MKNAWQCDRTLTPQQLEHVLFLLGMSQEACGRYLGVSGRTVRRYIRGERPIPESTVLLLRALVNFKVQPLVPRIAPVEQS
jgi:transcriptional regulator with XRE-family HTH domain